jgi:hypothetical protein
MAFDATRTVRLRERGWEFAIACIALAGYAWAMFSQASVPGMLLVLPMLVWFAWRYGPAGAAFAVLLVMLTRAATSPGDLGPIRVDAEERIRLVQMFISVLPSLLWQSLSCWSASAMGGRHCTSPRNATGCCSRSRPTGW